MDLGTSRIKSGLDFDRHGGRCRYHHAILDWTILLIQFLAREGVLIKFCTASVWKNKNAVINIVEPLRFLLNSIRTARRHLSLIIRPLLFLRLSVLHLHLLRLHRVQLV